MVNNGDLIWIYREKWCYVRLPEGSWRIYAKKWLLHRDFNDETSVHEAYMKHHEPSKKSLCFGGAKRRWKNSKNSNGIFQKFLGGDNKDWCVCVYAYYAYVCVYIYIMHMCMYVCMYMHVDVYAYDHINDSRYWLIMTTNVLLMYYSY